MAESPDRRRTGAKPPMSMGRMGARFPSAWVLDRYRAETENGTTEQLEPVFEEPAPAAGRAGARFPSAKVLERYDEAAPEEPAQPPEPPRPRRPEFAPLPFEADPIESSTRVRPYVLTKGRTRSSHHLAIETLVSVRPGAHWEGAAMHTEYQPVRALCAVPRSVAEIAALLAVPLGVARVLLGDMAEMHLVRIHDTARTETGRPPLVLMRRVLEGLHRL
jgi:hypothetical protein